MGMWVALRYGAMTATEPHERSNGPVPPTPGDGEHHHYRHLALMAALSLVSMYFLMYAMVDRPANVYGNLNQLFMAGLMTSPMILIELIVMRGMYENRKRNALIAGISIAVGILMFVCIRQQAAISDEQFLRSMIPHHSSGILMCQRAKLSDAQLRELCDSIISSQQEEILLMAAMLGRE
jgi:cation transport ATPase